MSDGRVTVFGGTGFLGRRVVARLLLAGRIVRVASRNPGRAGQLFPGAVGLEPIRADVGDETSVALAVQRSEAIVNAVSLYVEDGPQTFRSVHVEAAARVARLARVAGVKRLAHVSGIGADPRSRSPYIRSRGDGERAVLEAFPSAAVIRPAVMAGEGDSLVTPLSRMLRWAPVFPLFGRGGTRLQPPDVEDVATAITTTLQREGRSGIHELGGADTVTYRALIELIGAALARSPLLVPLPFAFWRAAAGLAEWLPSPPITRNQVELMRADNVASADHPGFAELGLRPRGVTELVPLLVRREGTLTLPERPDGPSVAG